MGGLGLVKTRGVESGTGGVMVKAVEVAWLEPVVRSGGGKAGTGGVDFGYGEREREKGLEEEEFERERELKKMKREREIKYLIVGD